MATLSTLVQRILNTHFTVRQKQACRDLLEILGLGPDVIENLDSRVGALELSVAELEEEGGDGLRLRQHNDGGTTILAPGDNQIIMHSWPESGATFFGTEGAVLTSIEPAQSSEGDARLYLIYCVGGAFVVEHSDEGAYTFNLPGGEDITLEQDDFLLVANPSFGQWYVIARSKSSGDSGTYSPDVNGTNNVDSIDAFNDFAYMRVGNFVYVSGIITLVPTFGGVNTVFTFDLPINSNLSSPEDVVGSVVFSPAGEAATILAASGLAQGSFTPSGNTTQLGTVSFMYRLK